MDSVFSDMGGGTGSQLGGPAIPNIGPGARNALGNPTGNPSSNQGEVPAQDAVFGDLGGGGVACQLDGGEVPALPAGTDPGGQGGR